MRGGLPYLLLCMAVLACMLPSCRKARVLGVGKMADIYAEMFVADQWLSDHPSQKRKADTTQFYGAIFERHGCTFEDYDASVNWYLVHPEKYNQVLKQASAKLKKEHTRLQELEKAIERQNAILAGLSVLHLPNFSPDSIMRDTALLWTLRDTIATDSLCVADSLAGVSSLAHADTVHIDTLCVQNFRVDSLIPPVRIDDRIKRDRP